MSALVNPRLEALIGGHKTASTHADRDEVVVQRHVDQGARLDEEGRDGVQELSVMLIGRPATSLI